MNRLLWAPLLTLLLAGLLLAAPSAFGFAIGLDAGQAPARSFVRPCAVEKNAITQAQASAFYDLVRALGLEEVSDKSLEGMVCTPNVLPRSLFFKNPCECAVEGDSEPTANQLAAFVDETGGPAGAGGSQGRDVRLELADPELYESFGPLAVPPGTLEMTRAPEVFQSDVAPGLVQKVMAIHQEFLANQALLP
ncbi:MAG: hypothetical protein JRJ59_10670 [Deltaproteobacteria bacterium]|nr:hypothetical protein [Deltaproteobacteria bacterium]MBW1989775.1 hypothetical protein [Deltaproteobacteria bacterium]